jgi:hypothetical protein
MYLIETELILYHSCYYKIRLKSDQILAELIQAEGKILLFAIHKLINSIWNKEELPNQWKESIHKKVTKLAVTIIVGYHCYQLHTKLYQISSS